MRNDLNYCYYLMKDVLKCNFKIIFCLFKHIDSKRKGDDLDINSAKSRKIERKCVDLIVLGIPWKSTEEVVRRYFEQYGEVVLCEVKINNNNSNIS
jgi:RNA recognition motif-containing protein